MALHLSDLYQTSKTEKVLDLEKDLKRELEELQQEIEENDTVLEMPSKAISSVPLPKDVSHYRFERKITVDRAMEVSQAQPLVIQSEVMKEEMLNAECMEYTPASLPLLLHEHFVSRIHQIIQCKYLHLLRWKRFCHGTSSMEALHPLYQKRMSHILSEYNDCVQRAHRLSVAREAYLSNQDYALSVIDIDDLLIYLRYLVCHLHSMKRFHQYLRVLQWTHILHKVEVAPPVKEDPDVEENTSVAKMASRYQDDVSSTLQRPKSGASRPSSAKSPRSQTPLPQPPPINPALLSTAPLPSTALVYAAAAAGGGIATDEDSLGLPLNVVDFQSLKPHLAFLLNVYGINFNLEGIRNTADEMEMFAAINRKFKQIFQRQEHMKTFKTYDRIELGLENWGIDSPTHALKQESNWIPYVKLKAEHNANQEKIWTQLRQVNNTDEILRMQAHFLHVSDADHVQEILQEHATAVRNPVRAKSVRVTTNQDSNNMNTLQVWRKIYSTQDVTNEGDDEDSDKIIDFDERDIENVSLANTKRSGSARKRRDSYDYMNTVQMLGLDEGEQNHNDPATVQGAYLSFLHLRHLRLRDLQRSCLSMFNYFRSLERTLTINDAGLTQDEADFKQTCPQNHRTATETDGSQGGGGGLASHAYLHNTPIDFKLNETEFVEFSDLDNHDDFYTVDDGRIHVQDQRGYYIMYDSATKDLDELEKDLMFLATHYIEKDRNLRGISKINKVTESARRRQQSTAGPGDFDIVNYAHMEVDRFGVMMDLWSNETAFMECKRELIDCYMEAYHHVFDRDAKRAIAQVIVNIMYQRPRYDLSAEYFVKIYRAECVIVRQHINLVKGVLDKQIEDEREYNQKVCRDGDKFGLPHRIIPKQPISVNHSKSALRNTFILEFHPTLAIAAKLPDAIKFALQELMLIHKPDSILDSLVMEKKLYEVALREWNTMEPIGTSFSPQMQKDLFSGVFTEDPLFLCEIAERFATEDEGEQQARGQVKQRNRTMMTKVGRVMEAMHVRHRLIDAAWETEILAKIYKLQAHDMGFDDFHMYMRFVQMEFAGFKEDAGKPPPTFITSVLEDESLVDRYTPGFLYLAIHELDEAHVGRFSFRSRDGIMEILKTGGLETLQVVLKTQIVHKNALTCAVQQAHACQPVKEQEYSKSGRNSPTETKSEKSSLTQLTGMSSSTAGTALAAKLQAESGGTRKRSPEAFMSLQLEKTPSRDMMLNEFVTKKNQMGQILRNAEEMTKLKRTLISQFCNTFNCRLAQFSLRGQLLSYYNSILSLLDEFPQVRDTYFMLGQPNEKKSNLDDVSGLQPDARQMRKRPRRLLSPDGKNVLNIWFIPHHTETLIMFKTLDDDKCVKALTYCLMIVSNLHDMLQYLCAHSRLGSSHARLGSQKMEFVTADWGGTEGVGAELRDIQKQIDNLSHPMDPREVSEFMSLRRDVMFLEFDTAVRHCMADTFLSTGNIQAYKSVINNMYHSLPALSNVQRPSVFSTYMMVPEPLEARDLSARELYPTRSFCGRNGPFPTMFWQWHMIEYYIQLCLAGLKDVDRHVANGEILGVTLLMEDVLQTGFQDISLLTEHVATEQPDKGKRSRASSAINEMKRASSQLGSTSKLPTQNVSLSRTQEPIKAYKLLKFFLLLWKCLEYLKYDWGKRKLGVESIESMSMYRDFCKVYKSEILLPVLQSVARRLGQGEMYEGIALDTDPLVMPRGASEIEVRAKQMVKLYENLECHMIFELRKKLARELTLVLAERGRIEETALPTDLWKRPVMKESFTIAKPHVSESFFEKLMSSCDEKDDTVTFTRKHLNSCIAELSRDVMAREKSNFESYTMYYENLLRSLHQNLYQKEQEVKQLKDQLKTSQQNTMVEVQCHLANQGHDLIMEITALRAKVAEMREMSFKQQTEIRERVRQEYDDLIQNLFNSTFSLKNKFDEFRNELHDDVHEKIGESRREASDNMSKVRQKYGSSKEADTIADATLSKSETLRELKHENHVLNTLILKMKAMKTWRQNHDSVNFVKSIRELKNESENNKKVCEGMRMEAEEQIILLRQQIVALRKALRDAQKEANDVKKQLDKELKEKLEKTHEAMQKARSQRQLEQAKQANIEKLIEELQDKECQLQVLSEEKDRNLKQHSAYHDKIRKDIEMTRKQLLHERNMKLDAFSRVDDLQAQVYDYESCVSRTQSAFTPVTPSTGKRSRAQSAHKSLTTSRGTPSSGLFPPAIVWPNNRTLTPDMGGLNNEPSKKILRPKTVGGRLRSRIAEQLLNELEFDKHQTIVQLEDLQNM
ncbi:hypothetical protein ACF0H5_014288 [Mactra antiquata]